MNPRKVTRTSRPAYTERAKPSPVKGGKGTGRSRNLRSTLRLTLGALALVVFMVFGRVGNVEVTNSQQADNVREVVRKEVASPFWDNNIIWISTKQLEEKILSEHSDLFSKVQITKNWLGRGLNVTVVERQAILRWQTTAGEYGLDPQGVITGKLDKQEGSKLGLIVDSTNLDVNVGRAVAPARFVTFVLDTKELLASEVNFKFVRGQITETTNELAVYTDKGYYLRLDSTRSAKEQVANLKLLLSQKVRPQQYVDLRLEHRAYYQ